MTKPAIDRSRILGFAFAAVLALIAINAAVVLVESHRADTEADRIVRESERSMYFIGQIGQKLSRMRSVALERMSRSADEPTLQARIADFDRELETDSAGLLGLLSERERAQWTQIQPLLTTLRAELRALAREPHGERVDGRIDRISDHTREFFAAYDRFTTLNLEETERALQKADRHLAFVRDVEIALGFGLIAVVAIIWATVRRWFARQARLLSDYMLRIEASNRDLEAFAGRVAHDLKNVISPIRIVADLVKRGTIRPDTGERLERITLRAAGMLDALLAFSRAEQPPVEGEVASLSDGLHAVAEELSPMREHMAASIALDEAPGLEVSCSPGLLHVVLVNVLSNAFKFLAGRPIREVRVVTRREGAGCVVEVSDTGPGIPREALGAIFQPFFRVPGVRAEGTGIGLATVRRVVDAHRGRITVDSTEGEGTRVLLWLPSPG